MFSQCLRVEVPAPSESKRLSSKGMREDSKSKEPSLAQAIAAKTAGISSGEVRHIVGLAKFFKVMREREAYVYYYPTYLNTKTCATNTLTFQEDSKEDIKGAKAKTSKMNGHFKPLNGEVERMGEMRYLQESLK
eukprot:922458-Amorphochlora_amoeboformis.AAC.1